MICTCQISQTYSPSGRIGDKFCDFTHSDHLGSSSWTTDANGHAIQHIEYLPFGEEFVNQHITSYMDRYTFTGKELDAESNLYYYDARYNSSTYSQFTSPDPMSDKYPSVSPYLYCAGNPIRFVDPTGKKLFFAKGCSPQFKRAFGKAIKYMNSKKTSGIFYRLQKSSSIIYISMATFVDQNGNSSYEYTNRFNPNTNTIYWNPLNGEYVDSTKNTKYSNDNNEK